MFEPAQWVAAWEITQIPVPYQQATETPGRELTIQLEKNKRALRQGVRSSGLTGPTPQGQRKWRFEMLKVESFTEGTAEPRMVHLGGGGASAMAKAFHPY